MMWHTLEYIHMSSLILSLSLVEFIERWYFGTVTPVTSPRLRYSVLSMMVLSDLLVSWSLDCAVSGDVIYLLVCFDSRTVLHVIIRTSLFLVFGC